MKIRILKNIWVEIEKPRLGEVWDKRLGKWTELHVENINVNGKFAYLSTYDGSTIGNVPVDAFEVVKN